MKAGEDIDGLWTNFEFGIGCVRIRVSLVCVL